MSIIFRNRKYRLKELPLIAKPFLRILPNLHLVKSPLSIMNHYFNRTSPSSVYLRNGKSIKFSNHPHDMVTFVLIFLRKDYGNVPKGSIVVDIGANIGVFSLYAAWAGAKKVYALEPSAEAFSTLKENIRKNNLEDVIIPIQKAASDISGEQIPFPNEASPYNAINRWKGNPKEVPHQLVETISLKDIVEKADSKYIDILKIDCEGKEFDILENTPPEIFDRIKSIRIEIHRPPNNLLQRLAKFGFKTKDTGIYENYWLEK